MKIASALLLAATTMLATPAGAKDYTIMKVDGRPIPYSEVAAAYMTWKLRNGASLKEALEDGLKDLDGFYTFLVGTADGFAVVRDPIACKHAVMAETDDWVAMATEWRAIASVSSTIPSRSASRCAT